VRPSSTGHRKEERERAAAPSDDGRLGL
jgi:hypothetical protein